MLTNTKNFLQLYDDFEKYFNSLLNISLDEAKPFGVALNNLLGFKPAGSAAILSHVEQLWDISRIRNTIQHNPGVYEISDESLEKIQNLHNIVFHPPKIREIFENKSVFSTTPDESLEKILDLMKEKNYTHIPVYENKNFLGVISDWTLLNFLTQNKNINININNFYVKDLDLNSKYKYYFVSQNMSVDELEKIFSDASQKDEKIGAILVTNLGKPAEDLLNIITPWDLGDIENSENFLAKKTEENLESENSEIQKSNIDLKLKIQNKPKLILPNLAFPKTRIKLKKKIVI